VNDIPGNCVCEVWSPGLSWFTGDCDAVYPCDGGLMVGLKGPYPLVRAGLCDSGRTDAYCCDGGWKFVNGEARDGDCDPKAGCVVGGRMGCPALYGRYVVDLVTSSTDCGR